MALIIYGHPFSSYCQKVLIALYERNIAFDFHILGLKETDAAFAALWPLKRMPLLIDGTRTVRESTTIIEYLEITEPNAPRLIATDKIEALKQRELDRIFDNYVMTPMQKIVLDRLRPEANRDNYGVAEARKLLDATYTWLDETMAGRTYATGGDFSIADCAAAPSLFYADWAHPIPDALQNLKAYRARLLARPSVAQAVDEARPYRQFFPLGAPDRD